MNNLTTSQVAQYCMQIQACKDKASTSVKVARTQQISIPQSVTEMNPTVRLSTLIVDEKGRSLCFNHSNELDSAVYIGLGTQLLPA